MPYLSLCRMAPRKAKAVDKATPEVLPPVSKKTGRPKKPSKSKSTTEATSKSKSTTEASTADVVKQIMASQEALHGRPRKRTVSKTVRADAEAHSSTETARKRKSDSAKMGRIPKKPRIEKAHSVSPSGSSENEPMTTEDEDTSSESDDIQSEDSELVDDDRGDKNDFCDLLKNDTPSTSSSASLASTLQDIDPEMLEIMNNAFQKQLECGPALSKVLSERVETVLSKFATVEELKVIDKECLRPENCPSMVVPQLNPEIWEDVYAHKVTKIRDQGLQQVQQLILRAMVPVVRLMDKAITGKLDNKVVMTELSEILKIQGFANSTLTYKRRQNMLPRLNPGYAQQLVSKQNKPSTLLFGDDFNKKAKEIKDIQGVAKAWSYGKKSRDKSGTGGYDRRKKSKNWGNKDWKSKKYQQKYTKGKKSKQNWKKN